MKITRILGALLLAVFAVTAANAQNTENYFYTPSGSGVNGAVGMCLNTSNKAVPCGANNVAPSPVVDAPYPYTPLTPGQYTPVSDAAATSLTPPTGATYAVVCFEGANHRITWDGTTTPTASIGQLMLQGQCTSLSGSAALAAFKTIAASAGGTFTVSYAK